MNKTRINYLVGRHFAGSATVEEVAELDRCMQDSTSDAAIRQALLEAWNQYEPDTVTMRIAGPVLDRVEGRLRQQYEQDGWKPGKVSGLMRGMLRYAAVLVLIVGAARLLYRNSGGSAWAGEEPAMVQQFPEAGPGGAKAVLLLGDGSRIVLDDTENGELANEAGALVRKTGDEVVYDKFGEASAAPVYNTMQTPKGGQYRLVLQDGTRVWLNASSSIRFPSFFSGNERSVQVEGEAYLEVAHDRNRPFIVEWPGGEEVRVLGTRLNIQAYEDEPRMQTTLLEGSVQLGGIRLTPGQAWINGTVREVDTDAVIAWKNGLFHFNNADIQTVMRTLSRWYNLEVRFEGGIPTSTFQGELKRDLNLSEILEVLSYLEVDFRMEGENTLVIKKK